ncbi:MAG TPA: DUF1499 domain-containing protein [Caulobacteraceae bacterium]|nr:DUF1499 domain-containing protein [Caulobacteraceae bacterium]
MERPPAPGWAKAFLTFALVLSVTPALLILVGAVGTKLGLWSWTFGFAAILVRGPFGVGWAPALTIAAIAVALVGVIISFWTGSWRRSLAALLISLTTMGAFIVIAGKARQAPPIHDVATDWSEPLMFSNETIVRRGAGANPVEADPVVPEDAPALGGQRIADINARTCPQARSILTTKAPGEAYDAVKAAMRANRIAVTTEKPLQGRIEGVATSFWYGFKDDVVVRIRSEGTGSRIDIRSVSRVGMSDLGQNCERITRLAAALQGSR